MTWRDSARERKLARRSANVNVVSVMDGAKIPRRLTHMRDALQGSSHAVSAACAPLRKGRRRDTPQAAHTLGPLRSSAAPHTPACGP